ncbi:MAG TPA: FecR family protein [Kofleriaceae bacterium]|nr:FecR family protein [Kofleriaceae bacterium]
MTIDDEPRIDRSALDAFEVPEPAPDLGDRFLARLGERTQRRVSTRALVAGAGLVVAAAAVLLVIAWPSGNDPVTGASAPTVRTTATLGNRGVAVIEPGGTLAWQITDDAARIQQATGDVFYRVERGGAFVVTTPAGEVRVRGTCFRVEADPRAVLVTVYEGKVELANALGEVELVGGERATAAPGSAPHALTAPLTAALPATPDIAALLARDRALRDRIAELEARLGSTGPDALGPVRDGKRPIDMSKAELAELAHECVVPVDVPPTAGSTVMEGLTEQGMRQVALTDAERAAVKRLMTKFQPQYQATLEQLYRELTGEEAELDPLTMILEITQKTPQAEMSAAYERVAAERAGLRPVATDKGSVIERYLRFAIESGDAFERELAAEIGAERARVFRRTWGMVHMEPGCPAKEGHP